ncbi:MAG: dienelactone hydrolase family protein [Planctomycetota bacterium]
MPDVFEVYEEYRRRFLKASAGMPSRQPWVAAERAEILAILRESLGIRAEWAPTVRTQVIGRTKARGFAVEHLGATFWPGAAGAANLYVPDGAGPVPAILLCCGHDAGCKTSPMYQAMAQRLAAMGAAVLVPDNIGQGERTPMGHADCVAPFACGTSVQGLIAMETMGWVEWLGRDKRIDPKRIGVIGNSGGGLLSMLIGALCPGVAAAASSGYPSAFDYIGLKEKKHCHCNILPKVVGRIEMWQVYGTIAPRPLFLFQGIHDDMFPVDIFHATARRVAWAYGQADAAGRFRMAVVPGTHPWDAARIELTAEFLGGVFGLDAGKGQGAADAPLFVRDRRNLDAWPEEALDMDALARRVTGREVPRGLGLWDVYPPSCGTGELPQVTERGETRQILAQFEAFLGK